MKQKEKTDIIPYYSTLPMLQPERKTKEAKVTVTSEQNVRQTRRWSEELKL